MSGSFVLNSVLFTNVRVHSFCTLDQAVIFPGSDRGWLPLAPGGGGQGMQAARRPGGGENADEDARRFYRSEQGIVLVTKPMLAKLG